MDVESLAKQLILQNMTPEQQTAVLDSIKASVMQAKDVQKQRIGENVQVVVQALKKLEADIRARYDETGKAIEKRVASIKDGKDGRNGVDGKAGKDGRPGQNGATGPRGADGLNGRDGRDGENGVSVTDANIDFDGSLIITLSSGRTINVGEVVAPDLAEKIKVITNGGGTSQTVIDALASLQTQIDNLIPSQTGNAGKFLTTDGTSTSWSSVAGGLSYQGTWNATTNTPTLASGVGVNGYYYITATAGSTNLDGITDWQIGDWLMFNGTVWQKIDQSNLVTSVNGQTGAVVLTFGDVYGPASATNNAVARFDTTTGKLIQNSAVVIDDNGNTSLNAVEFDITPATLPTAQGTLYWDNADSAQTLSLVMEGGNAIQQIGEEQYYRVKCSAAITEGQTVMLTGTVGASGGLTAAPASGLTKATAYLFMGVATESGALNDWIYITSFGLVRGINTTGGAESWVDGQILYYDPAVAGGLTKTEPTAPAAKIQAAAVVHAASNGSIFIRPRIGIQLDDLNDVESTGVATGDLLQYTAGGYWQHAAPSTITGIGSAINVTGTVAIANGGSGQTTAQLAMNAFAGAVTSGSYLRGDGTNVVMATIQAGDVPTLNQNTTGTASNVTGTVAIANGGTGQTTATAAFNALAPSQTSNSGKYLTTDGTNSSWAAIVSGASISNDTSTTSNLYPLFAAATSGTPTTIYTSDPKYLYKPSTGELQASAVVASNGLVVNSNTVATSYSIPSGSSAMSAGPMSVSGGITVTIPSGSRWVVL